MERAVYSVTALTREIKILLESSFPRLWVEGEISNFTRHSSGHLYFTLKDESAQLRCAMWKFRAGSLLFRPENGSKVLVEGDVQVYEKNGSYQLIAQQIQPAGVGSLQLAFEQLKARLDKEGLFAEDRKRRLPTYPETVGVITSPTGAAVRDIISVLRRRNPGVRIILFPVRVQGEGAAQEIASAIKAFNTFGEAELLIVGRGGGSLEDLWAFNEEIVARAIYGSTLPVISAVGHQTDFTIADFVADLRAPTPSAAAELAIKDRQELSGNLRYFEEKLSKTMARYIEMNLHRIQQIRNGYGFRRPLDILNQQLQQLDYLSDLLAIRLQHRTDAYEQKINGLARQLTSLNPQHVLNRGYSIVTKNRSVVREAGKLAKGDLLEVQVANGQFTSIVDQIKEQK